MIHTIEVLECSKDVVFFKLRNVLRAGGQEIIVHINRKGWPDIQIDRSSACAGNAEIETAW